MKFQLFCYLCRHSGPFQPSTQCSIWIIQAIKASGQFACKNPVASNPELKLKIAGGVLPFGAPPVFPIVANSLNGEKSALGGMS